MLGDRKRCQPRTPARAGRLIHLPEHERCARKDVETL